jgi:hypothetical protein
MAMSLPTDLVWLNKSDHWRCDRGKYSMVANAYRWSARYNSTNIGKGDCVGLSEGKKQAEKAFRDHFVKMKVND